MNDRYPDRIAAGRALVPLLQRFARRADALVLALPRGGVPVGFEVAQALHLPLDVLVVRKLGMPGQEELAIGAVASGGVQICNELPGFEAGVSARLLAKIAQRERREVERRERAYRGDRPPAMLEGKTAILVDDGIATGSTMLAAVEAARRRNARAVVVAAPVAAPEAVEALRRSADEVIVPFAPEVFFAIGSFYDDFHQVSDEEVTRLLGAQNSTLATNCSM